MMSEVEERPRLVMAGYGQHRSQWVKNHSRNQVQWLFIYYVFCWRIMQNCEPLDTRRSVGFIKTDEG